MNQPTKLSGVIAATVLPLTDDAEPDLDSYASFLDDLVSAGVGGLAVNCDSGEAMSLWPAQRRDVMRTAAEVGAGRVPIVGGIIASFTEQAQRLAEESVADVCFVNFKPAI